DETKRERGAHEHECVRDGGGKCVLGRTGSEDRRAEVSRHEPREKPHILFCEWAIETVRGASSGKDARVGGQALEARRKRVARREVDEEERQGGGDEDHRHPMKEPSQDEATHRLAPRSRAISRRASDQACLAECARSKGSTSPRDRPTTRSGARAPCGTACGSFAPCAPRRPRQRGRRQ